MKPRLTILLGAGSTVSLDRSRPELPGMPSTDELTACVSRMQFPKVIHSGTAFLQTAEDKAFVASKSIPAIELIFQALSNKFAAVNFELILYAIEQLLPLATIGAGTVSTDKFHPAIIAFVKKLKQYEILSDWSLLFCHSRECYFCNSERDSKP
jgi:hypothetical protein